MLISITDHLSWLHRSCMRTRKQTALAYRHPQTRHRESGLSIRSERTSRLLDRQLRRMSVSQAKNRCAVLSLRDQYKRQQTTRAHAAVHLGRIPSPASVLAQQIQGFPASPPAEFGKWFPGLTSSGTATDKPRLRILCFPNAGSAEDMYTGEGTGIRRAPSPLLVCPFRDCATCSCAVCDLLHWVSCNLLRSAQGWCRVNAAECLAVQPPGRAMRNKEEPAGTAAELAAQLLPVVASRLQQTPYIVRRLRSPHACCAKATLVNSSFAELPLHLHDQTE